MRYLLELPWKKIMVLAASVKDVLGTRRKRRAIVSQGNSRAISDTTELWRGAFSLIVSSSLIHRCPKND